MPNIYLACIDCVYNKGEWSFPSKTYPCGQMACIKPNNDISASTHTIDNKSIEALQAEIRELKAQVTELTRFKDAVKGNYTEKSVYCKKGEGMNYLEKSKELVKEYFNKKVEITDNTKIDIKDIYVVWSCKTLQNFKALVSTNVLDGMYYELTYNGDKKEWYLDAYKKWENVCIKELLEGV